MELALDAYDLTKSFPDAERFGLTSQTQRAASSVPANIAEGHAIGLPKPFIKHLRIATGSVAELETHSQLAMRLNYVQGSRVNQFLDHCMEVRRMLRGLLSSIQRRTRS
jgi:four helix bundle protein